MGLRLDEPLSLARFYKEAGGQTDLLNTQAISEMQDNGWLIATEDTLQTTETGRLRLEAVLAHIIA